MDLHDLDELREWKLQKTRREERQMQRQRPAPEYEGFDRVKDPGVLTEIQKWRKIHGASDQPEREEANEEN